MELKKSNIDVGTPILTKRLDPDYKKAKTTKALADLAALGSASIQMYDKEHEATMHKQAMNDYVNNTINPDLQKHEGAYAVTVAEADAAKHFQNMQNDIKLGKFNKMSPEEFQDSVTDGHREYKELIADSKFGSLEAAAYDKFWLKNGMTLSAQQASKYRITLKNDQSAKMLEKLTANAGSINSFKDFLLVAEFEKASLMGADEIKNTAFQFGAMKATETGDMSVLDDMDKSLNFSVDANYSKMYKTVQNEAAKKRNVATRQQVLAVTQDMSEKQLNGLLTPSDANWEAHDEDGDKLYTGKQRASMLIQSTRNKVRNENQGHVSQDLLGGVYSTASTKDKSEAAKEIMDEMIEDEGEAAAFIRMGTVLRSQDTFPVPQVREAALNLSSFDFINYDPTNSQDNQAAFKGFRNIKGFLDEVNDNSSTKAHLGSGTPNYLYLSEQFDMMTGATDEERFRKAMKANQSRLIAIKEKTVAAVTFSDDEKDDLHGEYTKLWKVSFWRDKEMKGNDEEVLTGYYDNLVRDGMQYHGLTQSAALKYADGIVKENWTVAHGRLQPTSGIALRAAIGGKPDEVLKSVLTNNNGRTLLTGMFGENFNEDNLNVRYNTASGVVMISTEDAPNKMLPIPIDTYKFLGKYNRLLPNGTLPNVSADYDPEFLKTEEGSKRRLSNNVQNNDFFVNYVQEDKKFKQGKNLRKDKYINNQNVKPPSEALWNKFNEEQRTSIRRGLEEVRYKGFFKYFNMYSDWYAKFPRSSDISPYTVIKRKNRFGDRPWGVNE